jgi:tetratricopeptide (TPR) repeat protein
MHFNPGNKVVKLCAEGMQLEAEGKVEEAHALFQKAWDIAENDFEAFTAAHYLARNQEDPNNVLKWNLEALTRAGLATDDAVKDVLPSLYLNVGKSYETLGNLADANHNYQLGADYSGHLPPGKYTDMIRNGIAAALERTGTVKFKNETLANLVDKWCAAKALRPLSFVLPAYVSNLGTEQDVNKLISALSYLSATRCLGDDEQKMVDEIISGLK